MEGELELIQNDMEKEKVSYENITQNVLSDFAIHFSLPTEEKISSEKQNSPTTEKTIPIKEVSTQKKAPSPEELLIIEQRLARLEKRIQSLDETKPEYTEEYIALGEKKTSIENNSSQELLKTDVLIEKERQLKEVTDLLNKKTFGYVAPVISPIKEEELRLKSAQEAQSIEEEEVSTDNADEKEEISDKHLQQASWTRESFIKHLQITNKGEWYENPSQNRDLVNEYVIKTAGLLSGKDPAKVNMDDIQTARLFLFKEAPEEVLTHPAFSYVESFYNYQNDQGHSGNSLDDLKTTQKIEVSI